MSQMDQNTIPDTSTIIHAFPTISKPTTLSTHEETRFQIAESSTSNANRPHKRRRLSALGEIDPSSADRFVAARSFISIDAKTVYTRRSMDHLHLASFGKTRQSSSISGNQAQVQWRYQNVLSSVITPEDARAEITSHSAPPSPTAGRSSLPNSDTSTRSRNNRPGIQTRSSNPPRLVSYFSSALSSSRTPLGSLESATAPKFRSQLGSAIGGLANSTLSHLLDPGRSYRPVNTTAYKVLDAPELEDNFYLHLVDWGRNDKLAVALGQAVYLCSANGSLPVQVLEPGTANGPEALQPAGLKWIGDGSHLALGNKRGDLLLYDARTNKKLSDLTAHIKRIGVLDATADGRLIACGSGDTTISVRDVRTRKTVMRIRGHAQEVCGLKFSPFEDIILASGGNDNKLFIWDLRKTVSAESGKEPLRPTHRGRLSTTPFSNITNPSSGSQTPDALPEPASADSDRFRQMKVGTSEAVLRAAAIAASDRANGAVVKASHDNAFAGASRNLGSAYGYGYGGTTTPVFHATEHRATVRGLAWSPHTRGLLASGGGKQEPIIRFWNTMLGTKVDEVLCEAQVTDLYWSTTTDELLSTHGFANHASVPGVVTIWHYPTRTPTVSFAAHTGRVSYLAVSPSNEDIATASSDETLRFFKVFPRKDSEPNVVGGEILGRVR